MKIKRKNDKDFFSCLVTYFLVYFHLACNVQWFIQLVLQLVIYGVILKN